MEDFISRSPDASYGQITATTFSFKIFLTHNYDDLGVMTNTGFVDSPWLTEATTDGLPNTSNVLVNKLVSDGIVNPYLFWDNPKPMVHTDDTSKLRVGGSKAEDYFKEAGFVTGYTDSKKEEVRSYSETDPFKVGKVMDRESYTNYKGLSIDGVDKVVQILINGLRYTLDGNDDSNIGTKNQDTGLAYTDDESQVRNVFHPDVNITYEIPLTTVKYYGEGWNETNTVLSAVTKLEYLIGISEEPEVQSDVFINRGSVSVIDRHMRLSEVKTIFDLENYGNGYFNIQKQ